MCVYIIPSLMHMKVLSTKINGQHNDVLNILLFCFHRGFNVLVKDLDGKNHQMTVNNLLFPIIVAESSKKVCHFFVYWQIDLFFG